MRRLKDYGCAGSQWRGGCKTSGMGCAERQVLAGQATEALREVSRITQQLIAAVRDSDSGLLNRLYSQLQAAEQEFDARIAVLRQHDRDHRCVALFAGEQE